MNKIDLYIRKKENANESYGSNANNLHVLQYVAVCCSVLQYVTVC